MWINLSKLVDARKKEMAESFKFVDRDETEKLEELLQKYEKSAKELSRHRIIKNDEKMLYSQDEARKIAEVIRERGDQINKMMYENFDDSQIYKRIWKQLCTKMTYIFRNVGQEPEQPLANSESGQLSVGHFKKSVEKHKHNLNELSKAIEESLHSDEEHESSEEVHTSTRTGWGEKIVQFVKSSDRLLGYLTQRTYPQETPETPIPASGACLQKSGADWWTPRICHSCSSGKDSTDWVVILPEAVALSANGGRKYRITAAPGSYECGVTGVRWKSSCEVELEYYWSNWDLVSEVLERDQYHPCGPLLDITVISGRLEAVHLPHFLCLGSEWLLGDAVQVCHVTDEGVSLERCILTRFHATLLHPTFSPKGVLVKNGFRVKAHCKILIYRVLAEPLTLHLYLIPDDSRMEEAVEKQESGKCVMISKPNPELSLQMKDWFKLKTMQKTKTSDYDSEITPECLKLRYTTRTPNFFEVYVNNPTEDFYLQMLAKDNNEIVWEVKIRKGDFSQVFRPEDEDSSFAKAVWFVDKHRTELIERVSLVAPIADDLKPYIGDQKYSIIKKIETSEDQMRELYRFLSGGQEIKRRFYGSLLKHEPYLVKELQEQKGS